MDKQKRIEEMARELQPYAMFGNVEIYEACDTLCNANYRKILEGEVVLTRERYDALKTIEKYHIKSCGKNSIVLTEKEYGELYQRMFDEVRQANDLKVEQARKEMAEKFAEMAKEKLEERECKEGCSADILFAIECVDEICKRLTGGK